MTLSVGSVYSATLLSGLGEICIFFNVVPNGWWPTTNLRSWTSRNTRRCQPWHVWWGNYFAQCNNNKANAQNDQPAISTARTTTATHVEFGSHKRNYRLRKKYCLYFNNHDCNDVKFLKIHHTNIKNTSCLNQECLQRRSTIILMSMKHQISKQ